MPTAPWETVPAGGIVTLGGSLPAGTNNIGDVDVLTIPNGYAEDSGHASGNVGGFILGVRNDANAALTGTDLDYSPFALDAQGRLKLADGATSQTARANTDQIGGTISNYPVKWAAVSAAGAGDNTLVGLVASRKIRVISAMLIASAAVTIRFESGAGGTALTGQMDIDAKAGFVAGYNPNGWFETAAGALLNLELSAAVQVSGVLSYIEAI